MRSFSKNKSVTEYDWKKPVDKIIRDCFAKWNNMRGAV